MKPRRILQGVVSPHALEWTNSNNITECSSLELASAQSVRKSENSWLRSLNIQEGAQSYQDSDITVAWYQKVKSFQGFASCYATKFWTEMEALPPSSSPQASEGKHGGVGLPAPHFCHTTGAWPWFKATSKSSWLCTRFEMMCLCLVYSWSVKWFVYVLSPRVCNLLSCHYFPISQFFLPCVTNERHVR